MILRCIIVSSPSKVERKHKWSIHDFTFKMILVFLFCLWTYDFDISPKILFSIQFSDYLVNHHPISRVTFRVTTFNYYFSKNI